MLFLALNIQCGEIPVFLLYKEHHHARGCAQGDDEIDSQVEKSDIKDVETCISKNGKG